MAKEFKPTTYQRMIRKSKQLFNPVLCPLRRSKLNNTDFTILSNNCWGGVCYESFGLIKSSPTVGSFFFAENYLKFLKNLNWYLNQEIQIIEPTDSMIYEKLVELDSTGGLVGILGDIEIVLLHYHDKKTAKEKWNRRVARINPNNLIVKFSFQNECKYEHLKEFEDLDLSYFSNNYKKIMFVPKPMPEFSCAIYYKGFENSPCLWNDTFFFDKYFKLIPFINGEGLIQR